MGFILCSEYRASQPRASVEMNVRIQWSSLNQIHQKFIQTWKHRCRLFFRYRNEFPRSMGFIFAHLQHSIAGMNSRIQWGSLPSAPNNSSEFGNVPSRHPQCTWRDEFPRPMGFILVQQRMQQLNLIILNVKVTGKVFPWNELPRQMGFILVHQ